ncbi:SVM family protein [Planococcus antarcticus]
MISILLFSFVGLNLIINNKQKRVMTL